MGPTPLHITKMEVYYDRTIKYDRPNNSRWSKRYF